MRSFHIPWLNMPEEFYVSMFQFAKQNSQRPEEVLSRALSVLEAAYHTRNIQPIMFENSLETSIDPAVLPVWFILPEEFWTRLRRLVTRTGKGGEALVAEGLNLMVRRREFTVIESARND